jgi:membrane protease YdiL (CAAX protease family)
MTTLGAGGLIAAGRPLRRRRRSWPSTRRGPVTAIAVTSICFAALHVPLYGWHVVPLDTAVGLWLGVLQWTHCSCAD